MPLSFPLTSTQLTVIATKASRSALLLWICLHITQPSVLCTIQALDFEIQITSRSLGFDCLLFVLYARNESFNCGNHVLKA